LDLGWKLKFSPHLPDGQQFSLCESMIEWATRIRQVGWISSQCFVLCINKQIPVVPPHSLVRDNICTFSHAFSRFLVFLSEFSIGRKITHFHI
jgi:hypothetical protein